MNWRHWGVALDRLPAKVSLPVGIGLGALAGALLLLAPVAVWVPAFLALFTAAGLLAWSGEPVEELLVPPLRGEPAPAASAEKGVLPSIELVAIPAGRFLMGSPNEEEGRKADEGPVHEVGISAFLCMKTPVTRRLYAAVMGSNPGWPKGDADDRPVNAISWFAAVDFCNQLSWREGLAPCYERVGNEISWRREADGYRLPTEAEWEYACRAGMQTRWSFGSEEKRLADHAWLGKDAKGEPRPIRQKLPNAWGLHDMHGNVWEWCWDRHGSYERAFAQDPSGSTEGPYRVLRGGSFASRAWHLRSAARFRHWPEHRFKDVGFRCVRAPRLLDGAVGESTGSAHAPESS